MYQVPSAKKRSWKWSPGLNGALAWVLGLGDQRGAGLRHHPHSVGFVALTSESGMGPPVPPVSHPDPRPFAQAVPYPRHFLCAVLAWLLRVKDFSQDGG